MWGKGWSQGKREDKNDERPRRRETEGSHGRDQVGLKVR